MRLLNLTTEERARIAWANGDADAPLLAEVAEAEEYADSLDEQVDSAESAYEDGYDDGYRDGKIEGAQRGEES